MKRLIFFLMAVVMISLTSCVEHYSDGERVGTVIKFSNAGWCWKSYDGELNLTQTGMNTSGEPFRFSFDNDRNDQDSLIELVTEAQRQGWKIKILYHQVFGFKNVCHNRGESDYFVDDVIVLDKNFAKPLGGLATNENTDFVIDGNTEQSDGNYPLGSKENPIHVVIDHPINE